MTIPWTLMGESINGDDDSLDVDGESINGDEKSISVDGFVVDKTRNLWHEKKGGAQ
jgi:hypothetical protein